MSWPTTSDGLWYLFEGQILIPVDPTTGAPIMYLRPQGGIGVGIPAIADGAPGAAAVFQTGAQAFTELDPDDPTAASVIVTEVSPGVYALSGALHGGAKGDDGTTSIDLASIGGTAAAGKLIKVNAGATGFDYMFEKVGDRYIPASIANTGAGNTNSTLAIIPLPNKNVDCRIVVEGCTIVTQNGGSNVVVDFLARLNNQTSGNVIAHCPGIGGTERLILTASPPAGAADSFDKLPAGSGTVNVYVRTEQQSGANSYTTSNSTTRCAAWMIPIG